MLLPLPCGVDNSIPLVPEVCGKPPMRGHHLSGGMNLLPVTGGVRGNFGCLPTSAAGTLQILANLLTARAGSVQVLLRVALDLWRSAPPNGDFVAKFFQS